LQGEGHLPAEPPHSNSPPSKPRAPDRTAAPSSLTQVANNPYQQPARLPYHQLNPPSSNAETKGRAPPEISTCQKQSPEKEERKDCSSQAPGGNTTASPELLL